MDLHTCDLDSIGEKEIERFLGLHLAPEQRPTEGERFDFKQEIPQDLGADVAAFANTYGGILVIGISPAMIAGKREKNIPGAIVGVAGEEVKLRILHLVRDTVYPVPWMEVVERRLAAEPAKAVVLIRIQPGLYPPYMYLKQRRIPIRRGDSTDSPSLAELESMFGRRNGRSEEERGRQFQDIHVLQYYPDDGKVGGPSRARNHQTISLVPWDFRRIQLDLDIDRRLGTFLSAISIRDKTGSLAGLSADKEVRARHVEFDKADYTNLVHRRWRFTQDGVVQFCSAIPYKKPEIFGNLLLDFFSVLKLAQMFHAECEYFGNVDLRGELTCIDAELEMKTPVIHGGAESSSDQMSGIHLKSPKAVPNRVSWIFQTTVTHNQLSNPVDLAATIYSEHLREIWQGEFRQERLRDQIRLFWEQGFCAHLPSDIR